MRLIEFAGIIFVLPIIIVLAAVDWLVTRHWSAVLVGFVWLFWERL